MIRRSGRVSLSLAANKLLFLYFCGLSPLLEAAGKLSDPRRDPKKGIIKRNIRLVDPSAAAAAAWFRFPAQLWVRGIWIGLLLASLSLEICANCGQSRNDGGVCSGWELKGLDQGRKWWANCDARRLQLVKLVGRAQGGIAIGAYEGFTWLFLLVKLGFIQFKSYMNFGLSSLRYA